MDYEIENLTESELTNAIKQINSHIENQKCVCQALEYRLNELREERIVYNQWIKKQRNYELFLRHQANAELIEKKVSVWMMKYWSDMSFLYSSDCKQYIPELIHTNCKERQAVLPRQIMIWMMVYYSGLKKSDIADYFEHKRDAAMVIHSVKTINDHCFNPKFKELFNKIETMIKDMNLKVGYKANKL